MLPKAQPSLSIIIPAKNEAGNLPRLLNEIATAFPGEEYEILAVDDGSTDETWTFLSQRGAEDARLRPLRHTRSAGQGEELFIYARNLMLIRRESREYPKRKNLRPLLPETAFAPPCALLGSSCYLAP